MNSNVGCVPENMDLSQYDGKLVRLKDIYEDTFSKLAEYGSGDFPEYEYGGEER